MRIEELLQNITSKGPLSATEYGAYAQQRDTALKQKAQTAQQARQQQQQLRQQQLAARSAAAKPKPIKMWARRRRKVRGRKSTA